MKEFWKSVKVWASYWREFVNLGLLCLRRHGLRRQSSSHVKFVFSVHTITEAKQSKVIGMAKIGHGRLNVLGDPGPARLMGLLWPTWRGGRSTLYQLIHTKVPIRVRHDVKWRLTNWCLTCLKCQNVWRLEGHVHCTKIIRPHSWATQLERFKSVQPLSPSLTLILNSNHGTNVLCVLCCICV